MTIAIQNKIKIDFALPLTIHELGEHLLRSHIWTTAERQQDLEQQSV
ncbi:MAG: hypothetical protein AAFO76_11490 [Cyanobacteria bacterium J06607_15]